MREAAVGIPLLCWPCLPGFSLQKRSLERQDPNDSGWGRRRSRESRTRWHQFPGGHLSPSHTTNSPSLGPLVRWEGNQPLAVPGKTAEWEDLGDTRSICLIVLGGSRGSGPGGKGPPAYCRFTVFGEKRASGPGPSRHIHAGAPRQGCCWWPFPDLLSLNIRGCCSMAFSLGSADHSPASRLVDALFCHGLQAEPFLLHGWLSVVFLSRKRTLGPFS